MKKIIMLSALVLGVVVLAGCGQQPVSQTQPTTPATTVQTPATNQPAATQPAPTTLPIDIAGWQTYANAKYGYEIKYPTNLTLSEVNRANADTKSAQQRIDLKIDNNSNISVLVWNRDASPSGTPQGYQRITVDGHDAIRGREYGNAYFDETYIYNGNYTYQIEYAGDENKNNIDIYGKIISIFKFTK